MRPLASLIPVEDARRRILAACAPVEDVEWIVPSDADGRVLAQDVVSLVDVPAFDRAAMDGYALRSADAGVPLRLVGNLHAGDEGQVHVGTGTCVQIATGAPIPPGADAVVMVERTRRTQDAVLVDAAIRPGDHISRRGSDLRAGGLVLRTGDELQPARIAVAVAAGATRLPVWRRPRVAIVSTGAELREPGTTLRAGQLYDSNGPALAAFARGCGADVVGPVRCEDDLARLRSTLRAHTDADLILTSGGSSAGERDVLRDAVAAEGAVDFHGVRVKPGKPLLLGRVARTPIVGLPGYPTSCLMDAYLFVRPALRQMARAAPRPERRIVAPLATEVRPVADRLWCLPVRMREGRVHPTFKESGATTSLSEAEGYIEVPAGDAPLPAATMVEVVLF